LYGDWKICLSYLSKKNSGVLLSVTVWSRSQIKFDAKTIWVSEEVVVTHSVLYFILSEDGDCNVCQNNGRAATYDAAKP
jgi:hypothetical protein